MPLNITSENATFLYFEAVIPDVWYSVADKKKISIFSIQCFCSCLPHRCFHWLLHSPLQPWSSPINLLKLQCTWVSSSPCTFEILLVIFWYYFCVLWFPEFFILCILNIDRVQAKDQVQTYTKPSLIEILFNDFLWKL